MILKKIYRDELLQIAIILSLMRVDPTIHLGNLTQTIGIGIDDLHGDSRWSHLNPFINRRLYIHPKCVNSDLLEYERDLFEDLNALGRYNRINANNDITAYLLNVNGTGADLEQDVSTPSVEVASGENDTEATSISEDLLTDNDLWLSLKDENVEHQMETELTQEDSYNTSSSVLH
ncbi:hypothetical protein RUM43_007237 [Polyplax serrata]|uniref:Uncharacterized protein n=1 Tax=Polyplax serrata TaxID=468196 RepID=A0AAN8PM47_POLSC